MSGFLAVWAATAALVSALLAVTRPSIVHALMWLVAALLSLAACFFALGASFAGAVQVLIYAGAIVAVFVFVVMTVDSSPEALAQERARLRQTWKLPAAVVTLAVLPFLLGLNANGLTGGGSGGSTAAVTAKQLGLLLFGPWAIAVEIASALLLAALMGARHLGRRGK